ncbi:hypothetical protein [Flavobacterium litorale]|uniref:Uncharacterized protein n=1 Tax=Flavobacterium litorale TaxID=2856519 RepID=A0ABX8VDJ8_9FLAO|nr:hypothetical protein [Flavobacterium litorale]QYJ68711.1 hypothetical protein K1I41_02185 [Flavobacterium litorale]
MRLIFTFKFLLLNLIVFSQEPRTIASGYITFNSDSKMAFKNMVIENENLTFTTTSENKISYALKGVKKIVDNYGTVVYLAEKGFDVNKSAEIVKREKTEQEKLVYRSSSKILLNGEKLKKDELEKLFGIKRTIYWRYKKGKSGATVGSILMGGGLGLLIGGGLSNIGNSNNGREGSPTLLVAGIVIGVVGIPIRILGVRNLKKAVKEYNALQVRKVSFLEKAEFNVIANTNGVGLQLQF